jgi:adenosylhomocysteine nucleosidase
MKVLVTFAVEAEFAPWRKLRKFRETLFNEAHYSEGVQVKAAEIGAHEVFIYLTGIGIKTFDLEAACCFKAGRIDAVISSGLAGALQAECQPLAVVRPRRVGTLRDANGIAVAKSLSATLEGKGVAVIDTLLTADHIIETHDEKTRLSVFGQAVDMESFHVVRAFTDEGIPVVVVRAISDGSDEDLPIDFEKCLTPEGKLKVGALLKDLAKKPSRVPEMIRFGRQSRAAAEKLVAFLDSYIAALPPTLMRNEIEEAVS